MRAALLIVMFAFAGTLFGAGQAAAQGIDCRRPPTAAEVTICRDPELLQLDDRLSRHYFRLRDELRGRGIYRLEEEQAGWREARRQCKYDVRCIHAMYRRRIDELREYRGRY